MDENPYEPPAAHDPPAIRNHRQSKRTTIFDVWPGEQWPFYLLLLAIAVAGVIVPLIATMNLPRYPPVTRHRAETAPFVDPRCPYPKLDNQTSSNSSPA
jgi:hypothetical protein